MAQLRITTESEGEKDGQREKRRKYKKKREAEKSERCAVGESTFQLIDSVRDDGGSNV